MRTIVVSIGNSDNRLTQAQWSEFVESVGNHIATHARQIHFFGGSVTWAPWQNVVLYFDCDDNNIDLIKEYLSFERKCYGQDSAAWLEGETQFI